MIAPQLIAPADSFVIHQGHVIDVLRTMESESVHCVVTSPPYWGLRDYQIEPSIWPTLAAVCDGADRHQWSEWTEDHDVREEAITGKSRTTDRFYGDESRRFDGNHQKHSAGAFCSVCGAWRGCLGLEPNPDLYVQHMVEIFRHVRRVLRNDGLLWLNLGDCYITNPIGTGSTHDPKYPSGRDRSEGFRCNRTNRPEDLGLKSKDLVMIPARVALALQADGWYLRSQIPWVKRNGMPDSTPDRPPSMVEYIFLLAKSEQPFYDRDAVRLPQAEHERTRRLREQAGGLDTRYSIRRDDESHGQNKPGANGVAKSVEARQRLAMDGTRVRRNADWFFESWQGLVTDDEGEPLAMIVNPQPFSVEMCAACESCYERKDYRKFPKDAATDRRICPCGAQSWISHFATFSERMVTPCILAGTSEKGCCRLCGAPYERIVEAGRYGDWHPNAGRGHNQTSVNNTARMASSMARRAKNGDAVNSIAKANGAGYTPPVTVGWRPTCSHPLFPSEPVPCIVLDPFSGSGRTGLAAVKLGRRYVGAEANPKYILMSKWQHRRLFPVEATA